MKRVTSSYSNAIELPLDVFVNSVNYNYDLGKLGNYVYFSIIIYNHNLIIILL